MTPELPPLLHSPSIFQKSEGSPSNVPDKVEGTCPEVKGHVQYNFSMSLHEGRVVVFNPVTGQREELPPSLHCRDPVLMHMYADPSSKAYHVLAAGSSAPGDESLSRITELYDSGTGQWERVGDLPGPAFALNEYQSGVFQNGNIFCIGFVELGDQTGKGILRYNVEEGLWSTVVALPDSSFLQLVENDGALYLISERDNGRVTEYCVDRIERISSEGADAEQTNTFSLVNVLKERKSGGRGLLVYPEFACGPSSESQLCIFNTVEHIRYVFDIIEDQEKSKALPAFHRNSLNHSRSHFLRFPILRSAPSSERFLPSHGASRSFGRFVCFLGVGYFYFPTVVGATPAPAPWSSPSTSQVSSTSTILGYAGVIATIAGATIAFVGLGFGVYKYFHRREDSLRSVVEELTRPCRESAKGLIVRVGKVKVGDASLNELFLNSFPGSSAESSAGTSPESSPRSSTESSAGTSPESSPRSSTESSPV